MNKCLYCYRPLEKGETDFHAKCAKKFFGTTDVIGKTIFRGKQADNNAWTIGGVYKDFPENSQIKNWVTS